MPHRAAGAASLTDLFESGLGIRRSATAEAATVSATAAGAAAPTVASSSNSSRSASSAVGATAGADASLAPPSFRKVERGSAVVAAAAAGAGVAAGTAAATVASAATAVVPPTTVQPGAVGFRKVVRGAASPNTAVPVPATAAAAAATSAEAPIPRIPTDAAAAPPEAAAAAAIVAATAGLLGELIAPMSQAHGRSTATTSGGAATADGRAGPMRTEGKAAAAPGTTANVVRAWTDARARGGDSYIGGGGGPGDGSRGGYLPPVGAATSGRPPLLPELAAPPGGWKPKGTPETTLFVK